MKKNFILMLCFFLLIGLIAPGTHSNAANDFITISTNNLNVRSGPGLSYKVVSKVQKGTTFPLLKEEGDWYQIDLGAGKKGWVANWLVSKNKAQSSDKGPSMTGTITGNSLRVRSGPGSDFNILSSLNKGERVQITKEDGNWYEVKASFGKGWISKDYVQISSDQATTNDSPSNNPSSGQITTDSLNVRTSPSLQSNVIGKLNKGNVVQIHSEQNGWTKITYSNQFAWISSEYVKKEQNKSEKKQANNLAGVNGKITATILNVRETSSLDGKIIGKVSKGDTFKIIEEKNDMLKIELKPGTYGWVAGWYIERSIPEESSTSNGTVKNSTVTISHNGTNIRSEPNLNSGVVRRANAGETFPILNIHKDWYEIQLPNGTNAFVAGWIVSVSDGVPQAEKRGSQKNLRNKTILIDPGHGGRDNGTTGLKGTLEKKMTLQTGQLLYNKLKTAGANVILTRNNDSYLSLASRVSMSHYHQADAFISIHYDSSLDPTAKGMTTYYYSSNQKALASSVHRSTSEYSKLKDRGVRFGDYHVIRENKQNAILLELGYLSNPTEEFILNTNVFQEQVTSGILQGISNYFKDY